MDRFNAQALSTIFRIFHINRKKKTIPNSNLSCRIVIAIDPRRYFEFTPQEKRNIVPNSGERK